MPFLLAPKSVSISGQLFQEAVGEQDVRLWFSCISLPFLGVSRGSSILVGGMASGTTRSWCWVKALQRSPPCHQYGQLPTHSSNGSAHLRPELDAIDGRERQERQAFGSAPSRTMPPNALTAASWSPSLAWSSMRTLCTSAGRQEWSRTLRARMRGPPRRRGSGGARVAARVVGVEVRECGETGGEGGRAGATYAARRVPC